MIHRAILVGRWVVDFAFATKGYDIEGVLSCLYDCGATPPIMKRAEELMETGGYNCGFTFSNPELMRAMVLIGPTTSGAEFIDTLVHEVHHLAVAIASELGIALESEAPAYLAGDSARALAEVVCEMGCPCCHKEGPAETDRAN